MTAIVTSAPALKLDRAEKAELSALLKSFGWTIAPDDAGTCALITKIGALVANYPNRQIADRRALETLREKMRGKIAEKIASERASESPIVAAMLDAAAVKLASVDASSNAPSLESQLASIGEDGGALGDVASLVTFGYRSYVPSDYPALKLAAAGNPKGAGPFSDPAVQATRDAFNVVYQWEKLARKTARAGGILPAQIARGANSGTAPTSTHKITNRARALAPSWLGFVALATLPQDMTIGDALAILGERHAASITLPRYETGERDVAFRAPVPAAPKVAPPSDTLLSEAKEYASDLERDVFIVKVGKRHEIFALSRAKMAAKYSSSSDAAIVAIVSQDGTVNRLLSPEQLSVAKIAPAIIASLTPPIDPASVVNVVNPATSQDETVKANRAIALAIANIPALAQDQEDAIAGEDGPDTDRAFSAAILNGAI